MQLEHNPSAFSTPECHNFHLPQNTHSFKPGRKSDSQRSVITSSFPGLLRLPLHLSHFLPLSELHLSLSLSISLCLSLSLSISPSLFFLPISVSFWAVILPRSSAKDSSAVEQAGMAHRKQAQHREACSPHLDLESSDWFISRTSEVVILACLQIHKHKPVFEA